jgi:hypoxanthine phosphoribosyltransferase
MSRECRLSPFRMCTFIILQDISLMSSVSPLFSSEQIAERVNLLADSIASKLDGDLVIVGLLKGSFIFVADLARALSLHGMTPGIEFMQVSSYGNSKESSGEIRISGQPPASISGKPVLLVDDIIDTGRTLKHTGELLYELGASQVWTCCLLDKACRREVECRADFTGFEVDDVFVVGYGIDHAENYRYLPFIGVVD